MAKRARTNAAVVPLLTVLLVGVLVAVALPPAARARQNPDLSGFDLRVRSGDLRPTVRPALPTIAGPEAPTAPFDTPDSMAEVDRLPRVEIPRRRGSGSNQAGDGGILQELLENQTIPLFRVTVEPPF